MANHNIRLRKRNGSSWDIMYPESLASNIKTNGDSNVQRFIDTVYDKTATQSANGAMSKQDKAKLDGIEAGANKYLHPNNATTRHVTDSEKNAWGDKYTRVEIDNKINELTSGLDWKESVNSFNDLASTYPNAQDGWTVNVKDTDITYRHTGTSWVAISANSIPVVSQSVDGKMSKEDKKILDNLTPRVNNIAADLENMGDGIAGDLSGVISRISEAEKKINTNVTSISTLSTSKADSSHNHNSSYAPISHGHNEYAPASHNHNSSYLGLSGGTITGGLNIKTSSPTFSLSNASNTLVSKFRANDSGSLIISPGADKVIYLRPDGDASTVGQFAINTSSITFNGTAVSLNGHGNHIPAIQSANNAVYLRNDNTWQTITPDKIGASPSGHIHNEYLGKGEQAESATVAEEAMAVAWANVTGKPSSFYTHPNDSNTRHVSDAQITTWNGKASTSIASTSANGLMSKEDKSKLDGISAGGGAKKFAANIGNGSSTEIRVAHGLATADLVVTVKEVSSNEVVYPDIRYDSTNVVATFGVAPSTNQYRIIVVG